MKKENENCVKEKLNDYVLQQPWSSLSFTGKVRKTLLKTQRGLSKLFCNKVFSFKTIQFLAFLLLMILVVFFALTFYFYTDYVFEQIDLQKGRKLTDKKQILTYTQYLKSLWPPLKTAIGHTKKNKVLVM